MNKQMTLGVLVFTLAAGCGAPITDGAEDQDPAATQGQLPSETLQGQSVTPSTADASELASQQNLSDPEFEQLFGFSRTAQRCQAMKLALSQKGIIERPFGSNEGTPLDRYVRWFYPGEGPVPWCAAFVSWAIDMTDNKNHRAPWSNPLYVGSIHDWGAAPPHDRLAHNPAPCDIVGWGDHHVGFVTGVSKGCISTVEGNANNQVERVACHSRTSDIWFLRY